MPGKAGGGGSTVTGKLSLAYSVNLWEKSPDDRSRASGRVPQFEGRFVESLTFSEDRVRSNGWIAIRALRADTGGDTTASSG